MCSTAPASSCPPAVDPRILCVAPSFVRAPSSERDRQLKTPHRACENGAPGSGCAVPSLQRVMMTIDSAGSPAPPSRSSGGLELHRRAGRRTPLRVVHVGLRAALGLGVDKRSIGRPDINVVNFAAEKALQAIVGLRVKVAQIERPGAAAAALRGPQAATDAPGGAGSARPPRVAASPRPNRLTRKCGDEERTTGPLRVSALSRGSRSWIGAGGMGGLPAKCCGYRVPRLTTGDSRHCGGQVITDLSTPLPMSADAP